LKTPVRCVVTGVPPQPNSQSSNSTKTTVITWKAMTLQERKSI
jgi:hypothetical protein